MAPFAVPMGIITMLTWKAAIAAAVLAVASPAVAGPITFETAPYGPGFTGQVTENGYTYEWTSGSLFVNQWGHPGQDMEAREGTPGGAFVIYRKDHQTFTLNSIDFAAFEQSATPEDQALSLVGIDKNGNMFQEYYTLLTTNVYNPTYPNWTTEFPTLGGLAGVELQSLSVVLFSFVSEIPCFSAVDNVNLSLVEHNPGVPEPASLSILAAGLIGFAMRRRAKQRKN